MTDDEDRRAKMTAAGRAAERITNPVLNLAGRGQPITDAAASKLYEIGIAGKATILKAPMKQRVSEVKENIGRFTVRVELPGEEPYEAKVWQSFWAREWRLMRPGTVLECFVDPDHRDRILLQVPEPKTPEEIAEATPKHKVQGPTLDLGKLFRKR
jgi:hypothetical protein